MGGKRKVSLTYRRQIKESLEVCEVVRHNYPDVWNDATTSVPEFKMTTYRNWVSGRYIPRHRSLDQLTRLIQHFAACLGEDGLKSLMATARGTSESKRDEDQDLLTLLKVQCRACGAELSIPEKIHGTFNPDVCPVCRSKKVTQTFQKICILKVELP